MPWYKKFATMMTIYLIVNSFCIFALLSLVSCDNDNRFCEDNVSRPSIEYLNETRELLGENFISVNRSATVVELKCTFTKPVTWEFKSDPWSNYWADYFWILSERHIQDFYNPSSYTYSIYLRLRIYTPKLPRQFICHEVGNKCANTKVLLNASSENDELMEFKTLDPLIDGEKLWENATIKDRKECKVTFILQPVESGKLRYKCVNPDGTELPKKNFKSWLFCYHADDCKNQLSMTKHKPRCVRVLRQNNTCENCKTSHDLSVNLLQCQEKDGGAEDRWAQPVFYSLGSDTLLPKLYISWSGVDLREMIKLEKMPQTVYIGDLIKISCHLSPYIFAAPAYIAMKFSDSEKLTFLHRDLKFKFQTGRTEFSNFFDGENDFGLYDSITNTFSYKYYIKVGPEHLKLREIYCFAAPWNATSWANRSHSITVLQGSRQSGCNIESEDPKVVILPKTKAFFSTPDQLVVSNKNIAFQLNCTSNGPVKWNLNSEEQFQEAIRNGTQLYLEYNQKRKIYNAILHVQSSQSLLASLSPSCEKINNPCQRTTVAIKNSLAAPSAAQISVLSYADPPKRQSKAQQNCQTLFIVKVEDNGKFRWKCVDYFARTEHMKAISQIYCDNYASCNPFYQEEAQKSAACIKLLQPSEACDGCELFPKGPSDFSFGYLRNFHRERISYQHFFYSLTNSRNAPQIYFDLESAPKEDMLIFDKINSTLYVKENLSLSCHFSPFYFARGYSFVLVFKNSTKSTNFNGNEIEEKFDEFHNVMTATTKVSLASDHLALDRIICEAVRGNKEEIVGKSVTVEVLESTPPLFVGGAESERKQYSTGDTPESLRCEAFGAPRPQITWKLPKELDITLIEITTNDTVSILTFPVLRDTYTGSYSCVASNIGGEVEKQFNVEIVQGTSKVTVIIVTCVIVVAILLLFSAFITIHLFLRTKQLRMVMMILSDEEIDAFRNGFEFVGENNYEGNLPLYAAPFNVAFEIALEKFSLKKNHLLGSGAFGHVYLGNLIDNTAETFAVKTVSPTVDMLYFKALLSEVKVMTFIGEHPHIVKFVGACTENIRNKELYIITELCQNGNLHNLLVSNRNSFDLKESLEKNEKGRRQHISQILSSRVSNDYDNVAIGNNSKKTTSFYENRITKFTNLDLNKWATQICEGMEHLEAKRIIHGDLATRNILLTMDYNAKISDFGLSRQLANYATYVKTTKVKWLNSNEQIMDELLNVAMGPMPWRHMAIESLKDMKFSTKSDVWAYGVTLWEIYTLGEIPYPGWTLTTDFVNCLDEGLRLSKPKHSNWKLFDCMIKCWNADIEQRPSFQDLKVFLTTLDHSYENSTNEK